METKKDMVDYIASKYFPKQYNPDNERITKWKYEMLRRNNKKQLAALCETASNIK